MSFQGKNFQSRSSDNNNTTAKCKHYSSYQYFTIINGEREINEAIKLISCVGSQDLEALKKKKKIFQVRQSQSDTINCGTEITIQNIEDYIQEVEILTSP